MNILCFPKFEDFPQRFFNIYIYIFTHLLILQFNKKKKKIQRKLELKTKDPSNGRERDRDRERERETNPLKRWITDQNPNVCWGQHLRVLQEISWFVGQEGEHLGCDASILSLF